VAPRTISNKEVKVSRVKEWRSDGVEWSGVAVTLLHCSDTTRHCAATPLHPTPLCCTTTASPTHTQLSHHS
jgi:hypothetical protein